MKFAAEPAALNSVASKRDEADLSLYRALIDSSHDAIIAKDLEGVVTLWNGAAERLFGYSEAEIRGRSVSILLPAGHDDDLPELLARLRAGLRVEDHETVRTRKDGTRVPVALTLSPILDPLGDIVGISTIARDISARVQYQQQLRYLADHDPLTGARNRRRFEQDLSEQISRSRRYAERAALLFMDLDGFKQINDRFGHRVGDQALQAVTAAVKKRLRATDVVARVGGDEFCILLPYASAEQGRKLGADLQALINASLSVLVGETGPRLGVSVGVVEIDQDTTDEEEVLDAADQSMYRDKATAQLAPASPADAAEQAPRNRADRSGANNGGPRPGSIPEQ